MRRRVALWTVLAVVVALTGATTWLAVRYEAYLSTPIDPSADRAVVVTVPKGSFDRVVEVLERRGLVKDRLLFTAHATITGKRHQIKAGTFFLDPRWTPRELLARLTGGAEPADYKVLTVPEGLNVWQTAEQAADCGVATRQQLLDVAARWDLARELGLPAHEPKRPVDDRPRVYAFEGYLFPETYRLPLEADAEAAVRRMARQFNKEWKAIVGRHPESYRRIRQELHLDDHALVTLASIVEEEAVVDAERPLIAAVFYNRLRKGMKLETDPTLVYREDLVGAVPAPKHRKDRSNPYNTYQYKGLPPGPISSPGRASLEAVVAPAKTDKLFFVARRDGSGTHYFSATAEEHRDAVRRFLK